MADLRVDPLSGRLVAVAPGRAGRPGANAARIDPPTAEELENGDQPEAFVPLHVLKAQVRKARVRVSSA